MAEDKPGWAHEKAGHIRSVVADNWAEETPLKITERIAADLHEVERKAKVAGLREAAEIAHRPTPIYNEIHLRHDIAREIRERATKIERGEI